MLFDTLSQGSLAGDQRRSATLTGSGPCVTREDEIHLMRTVRLSVNVLRNATFIFTLVVLPAANAGERTQARTVDIRECPLDTITFVDPWAGGTFEVRKVGADYHYACSSGIKLSPSATEDCKGPLGDLIVEGEYRPYGDDTERQTVFAIYTTINGSPCCGWSSVSGTEASVLSGRKNFKWFSAKNMPTLGHERFASIDPGESAPLADAKHVISNPLIALKCSVPSVRR
jgi:hypothetical protein